MATLSWGKPTVETVKLINGEIPTEAVWIKFPEIKTGTAKLTTTKGNKVEAIAKVAKLSMFVMKRTSICSSVKSTFKKDLLNPFKTMMVSSAMRMQFA